MRLVNFVPPIARCARSSARGCNQVTRDAEAAVAFTAGDAIYGPRSVEHWKEKEEEYMVSRLKSDTSRQI